MEYAVSFTGFSDAAEADNKTILDGMEYAVSFTGVSDAAEEALTCGQEREDTEDAES
jgi:hypothetical protein